VLQYLVIAFRRGALEQDTVFTSERTRPNFSFGRVFRFRRLIARFEGRRSDELSLHSV
jgi:hypothetical protein